MDKNLVPELTLATLTKYIELTSEIPYKALEQHIIPSLLIYYEKHGKIPDEPENKMPVMVFGGSNYLPFIVIGPADNFDDFDKILRFLYYEKFASNPRLPWSKVNANWTPEKNDQIAGISTMSLLQRGDNYFKQSVISSLGIASTNVDPLVQLYLVNRYNSNGPHRYNEETDLFEPVIPTMTFYPFFSQEIREIVHVAFQLDLLKSLNIDINELVENMDDDNVIEYMDNPILYAPRTPSAMDDESFSNKVLSLQTKNMDRIINEFGNVEGKREKESKPERRRVPKKREEEEERQQPVQEEEIPLRGRTSSLFPPRKSGNLEKIREENLDNFMKFILSSTMQSNPAERKKIGPPFYNDALRKETTLNYDEKTLIYSNAKSNYQATLCDELANDFANHIAFDYATKGDIVSFPDYIKSLRGSEHFFKEDQSIQDDLLFRVIRRFNLLGETAKDPLSSNFDAKKASINAYLTAQNMDMEILLEEAEQEKSRADLADELAQFKQLNLSLERELDVLKAGNISTTQQRPTGTDIDELYAKVVDDNTALKDELVQERIRIDILKDQNIILDEEVNRLRDASNIEPIEGENVAKLYSTVLSEKVALQNELAEEKVRVASLKERNAISDTEITRLLNVISVDNLNAKNSIEKREEEIKKLNDQLIEISTKGITDEETKRLIENGTDFERRNEKLEREMEELTANTQTLEEDLAICKAKNDKLVLELQQRDEMVAVLKSDIITMEGKVKESEETVDRVRTREKEAHERYLAELKEMTKTFQEIVTPNDVTRQMMKEVENLTKKNEELQGQIDLDQNALRICQTALENCNNESSEAVNERQANVNKIKELSTKLEENSKALKEKEAQVTTLKLKLAEDGPDIRAARFAKQLAQHRKEKDKEDEAQAIRFQQEEREAQRVEKEKRAREEKEDEERAIRFQQEEREAQRKKKEEEKRQKELADAKAEEEERQRRAASQKKKQEEKRIEEEEKRKREEADAEELKRKTEKAKEQRAKEQEQIAKRNNPPPKTNVPAKKSTQKQQQQQQKEIDDARAEAIRKAEVVFHTASFSVTGPRISKGSLKALPVAKKALLFKFIDDHLAKKDEFRRITPKIWRDEWERYVMGITNMLDVDPSSDQNYTNVINEIDDMYSEYRRAQSNPLKLKKASLADISVKYDIDRTLDDDFNEIFHDNMEDLVGAINNIEKNILIKNQNIDPEKLHDFTSVLIREIAPSTNIDELRNVIATLDNAYEPKEYWMESFFNMLREGTYMTIKPTSAIETDYDDDNEEAMSISNYDIDTSSEASLPYQTSTNESQVTNVKQIKDNIGYWEDTLIKLDKNQGSEKEKLELLNILLGLTRDSLVKSKAHELLKEFQLVMDDIKLENIESRDIATNIEKALVAVEV